ncbi:membrane protein insertase YidC [Oecophyllibacter saccharovorans]|uniref:membrane protein insertase YidC n=1 Tax=Oecophyllibacter saccharovorans TaxID=2558360 RepID=UPI00116F0100|nr:membrane protein insertase YidC [Oecophyllibacter saccharovorans]TPW36691.1 membrane protein insertase YidC [Oecophyllibacter saccharovorans]
MDSSKRIILAIVLSGLVLLGFNYLAPRPHHAPAPLSASHSPAAGAQPSAGSQTASGEAPGSAQVSASEAAKAVKVEEEDQADHRLAILGHDVRGSFNLRGARLDDLLLTRYRETVAKDSPLVHLLNPIGTPHPTYVVLGWQNGSDSSTKLPDVHSLWVSDSPELTPQHPATLRWENGAGVTFLIHLALDDHYMFTVRQEVENHSGQAVSVRPTQLIRRDYLPSDTGSMTAYEGPIAVMNGHLEDMGYKKVRTRAEDNPDHLAWSATSKGGWVGLTDKYWLTAIGARPDDVVTGAYGYESPAYLISLRDHDAQRVEPGASLGQESYLFAGAKVPSLLAHYQKALELPSFDKAIDYGYLSFLTRPILALLDWLYHWIGNFGIALLILTLIIKLILSPLAYKAAVSAARMRLLAPKIKELREKGGEDPMALNRKIMALYREEKVNPAGGCLPILIQAPIFFCLYKMLNISIDERHAPFFGWINDLSVPDPTNLFNLFGLLPFDPTHLSSFLHVSAWALALGATFWLLQRQTMVSMDPAQARMMQFMPLVYVFIMSGFPAGLMIYYTWNNILTWLQQTLIERHTKLPVPVSGAAPVKGDGSAGKKAARKKKDPSSQGGD